MLSAPDPFDMAADILDPPNDTWKPEPHQIPPAGNWFVWMLLGGRGSGKTATAARHAYEHAHGPACLPQVHGGHWMAIVAPTLGDAATSCVNGPSGIKVHDPGARVKVTPGGTICLFSNGAEAKMFGASTPEDVERFRSGGNRCYVWAEELAAWRYLEEAWAHIRFGLRVGPHPQMIISTTPKNRALIKKLKKQSRDEPEKYKLTVATTHDNPHLHEERKQEIIEDYGDSRLGRQEIYAEVLEDVEGALWSESMIDRNRLAHSQAPDMENGFDLIVIGVDPSGSSGGDETGIIVLGVCRTWGSDRRRHGFVLGDYSVQGSPNDWTREVSAAYSEWNANRVIAETNYGGDMVKFTIRSHNPTIPVEVVHASRGKAIRAEPVSTLYEQDRIHHVGIFPKLEEQMTEWDAGDPDPSWSPDRMDALVWAVTATMVTKSVTHAVKPRDHRLAGRR